MQDKIKKKLFIIFCLHFKHRFGYNKQLFGFWIFL